MNINRESLVNFRRDFENVVKDLESKYGVNIKLNRITFDVDYFKGNITVTNNLNNNTVSMEMIEWNKYAQSYGLNTNWVNEQFYYKDGFYKIIGFRRSKRKYPVIVKNVESNKTYCFTIKSIIDLFN